MAVAAMTSATATAAARSYRAMTTSGLPAAELEVLAALWQLGEATSVAIRERLERPLSHSSVMTLLGRLEEKGHVTRRKPPRSRAFLYRPAEKPQATRQRILRAFAQRVFGGNPVALVASLFQGKKPSAKEVHELQTLLDDLKSKSKGPPK